MCTTTTMSLTMENSFFRKYCKVISLQLIKINEKRKKKSKKDIWSSISMDAEIKKERIKTLDVI